MGETTDLGAVGRVEHGHGAATFGIAPLAVDEKLGVGISHDKVLADKQWVKRWAIVARFAVCHAPCKVNNGTPKAPLSFCP